MSHHPAKVLAREDFRRLFERCRFRGRLLKLHLAFFTLTGVDQQPISMPASDPADHRFGLSKMLRRDCRG